MDPKEIGVFRWAIRQAKHHLGSVLMGLLGVPVAAGIVGGFVRVPADPTTADRLVQGAATAIITFGVVLIAAFLYAVIVAPYQQRNALRAEIADHMESEHPPGDLGLAIRGPTAFTLWSPNPEALRPEKFLMMELNLPLITNHSDRDWNLSMFLDGWVGEDHVEINKDLWRRVWNQYPKYRENYHSNPLEVGPRDVVEGTVPFLVPFNADWDGQRLERPRVVIKDNKVKAGQIVVLLPLTENEEMERIWEFGVQEAISS